MMTRKTMLCLLAAIVLGLTGAQARTAVRLTGEWTFARADNPTAWQHVDIPHSWNAQDGTTPGYYRGAATYRCRFDAPPAGRGDRTFIRFEGVSQDATVWLNGKRLGRHQGAFTAFCFELTKLLKPRGNELCVEVTNAPDSLIMPLEGDFTIFGGIYRPVTLLVLPKVCFTPMDYASTGVYISQTEVSQSNARLDIKAKVDGAGQHAAMGIRTTVFDPSGRVVAAADDCQSAARGGFLEISQQVNITEPQLWDGIDNPQRYRFVTELMCDGKRVDELTTEMGLRFFKVDPHKGFFLNERSYPLHGVNRHQDRQGMGWAITEREHDEDMAIIQEIGANCIRLAHYPHSGYFYELCDRAGMMVWAEIPYVGRGTRTADFDANALQQLTELIRQNYNHESIFCWSLFNELGGPGKPHELVQLLNDRAHAEDPTRLTVAAVNNDGRPENDMPDIIAYNTYPGWYWAAPDAMQWAIDWKYSPDRDRAIGISEYGAGASVKQHDQHITKAPKTDGPYHPEEWQATVHEVNYREIAKRPYVWGSFVWNMFDFASAGRHEGDTQGMNDKGLVTYDRQTCKDAFYFYQANWSKQPMVYITSRRHTPRSEAVTDIKLYTNCPTVNLKVNGREVPLERGELGIVIARGVTLQPGNNLITATAQCDGTLVTDQCVWMLKTN